MKKLMITLAILLAIASIAFAKTDISKFTEVIDAHGKCVFTDGSSIYQFHKDGNFILEPNDMFRGRTIHGKWKTEDGRTFLIVGKWGLINGISGDNDYRRLTLSVTLQSDQPEGVNNTGFPKHMKVWPVYFTVEELKAITKEEYEESQGTRCDTVVRASQSSLNQ
jgi:hypothetical protein